MLRKIITGLLFLFSIAVSAQTVNDVFKNLNRQYTLGQPLQYHSNYALYKNHDAKQPTESYNGVFFKNASNELYMKIDNTEIVNSKAFNIKISHSEKAVILGNPVPNYSGEFDINNLTSYCTVSSFKDYKTYWEIILTAKKFSSLPYSKIVLNISKDYFLQKQIFYYNTGIDFSKTYKKQDTHYPRLEVVYSRYNREPASKDLYKTATYFSRFGAKETVLAAKLKTYQLTDNRLASINK